MSSMVQAHTGLQALVQQLVERVKVLEQKPQQQVSRGSTKLPSLAGAAS